MFRPIYNDHLQAYVLGGVVNTVELYYVLYEISYHVHTSVIVVLYSYSSVIDIVVISS
jgi:hypothetical protein